jgi:hypothetical protein
MRREIMKYLAILLSLYTLYLVSTPCVDEALHCNNVVAGQTEQQHPGGSEGHADACSPFCICSCCSVPVTLVPGTFISQPFFSFQRSILPESPLFISFFSVAFWQPPKLG